jgi:carbamoyltransferase
LLREGSATSPAYGAPPITRSIDVFPSPFQRAGVLCLDGVGEWATTSVWLGEDSGLTPQWQIDFSHSLGMLYFAFTYFTGFMVNPGEYKLMGLAPYGEPLYAE